MSDEYLPHLPMSSYLREIMVRNPSQFTLHRYREKIRVGYYEVTEATPCGNLARMISSVTPPGENYTLALGTFVEFPDHNFSLRRYIRLLENLCIPVFVSSAWFKIYWHSQKEKFCLNSTPAETFLPGEKVFCVVLKKP